MFCVPVPLNVTVPPLVKVPLFVKSQENVVVVDPAAYVPPEIFIVPVIVMSLEGVMLPVIVRFLNVVTPLSVLPEPLNVTVLVDAVNVPLFVQLP